MKPERRRQRIYDGDGDRLMEEKKHSSVDRIIVLPDTPPSRHVDPRPRLRIMWGQNLLEDLLSGRYRSLVCAVNAKDNSRGIITQLGTLLKTSQWEESDITKLAQQFSNNSSDRVKILKYDMDLVEVFALLRPPQREKLQLEDLAVGFKIIGEMITRRPDRQPSASVSFLGARSNLLVDSTGNEPSFETVLRIMYESGYTGDVYPPPDLWRSAPTAVYARYPFPPSLENMRQGGF